MGMNKDAHLGPLAGDADALMPVVIAEGTVDDISSAFTTGHCSEAAASFMRNMAAVEADPNSCPDSLRYAQLYLNAARQN